MRRRTLGSLALLALAVICLATAWQLLRGPGSQTHYDPYAYRPFAPDSVWNEQLAPDTPIAADSDRLVTSLAKQVRDSGTWINTERFSTPVYRVAAETPKVDVTLDTSYPPLARALRGVPIPQGAIAAGGTDHHLVIHQRSSDTMWELWLAKRRDGQWHARWGARMSGVSRSLGYLPAPLGATATGLPLLGGLMRVGEVRRGEIHHALAFSLPQARAGELAAPATRTDGQTSGPDAIPLGTRFRLDPRVDVARLHLPPATAAMALAVQRYGMIARDKAGSVAFYGEQPKPTDTRNPWGPVFKGVYPDKLLARFPWNRLEVVKAHRRRV